MDVCFLPYRLLAYYKLLLMQAALVCLQMFSFLFLAWKPSNQCQNYHVYCSAFDTFHVSDIVQLQPVRCLNSCYVAKIIEPTLRPQPRWFGGVGKLPLTAAFFSTYNYLPVWCLDIQWWKIWYLRKTLPQLADWLQALWPLVIWSLITLWTSVFFQSVFIVTSSVIFRHTISDTLQMTDAIQQFYMRSKSKTDV